MAEVSVSGFVDDEVADRLTALARAEARSPANFVAEALELYIALPEMARASLRRVETSATAEERQWLENEFARLLVKADMGITQRKLADEMRDALPRSVDPDVFDAIAVEWTDELGH